MGFLSDPMEIGELLNYILALSYFLKWKIITVMGLKFSEAYLLKKKDHGYQCNPSRHTTLHHD